MRLFLDSITLLTSIIMLNTVTVSASTNMTHEARVYSGPGRELPYGLFIPANYDSASEYPLVIMLHGAGGRRCATRSLGDVDPAKQKHMLHRLVCAETQTNHPCFILTPLCPPGNQWVDWPWYRGSYSIDRVPISDEMRSVLKIIESVREEFNIDSCRMYVVGQSMGGYGAWDLICRYPDFFAAAIPICGAGDPSRAGRLAGMGIRAFHGAKDPTVPPSGSEEMIAAIKSAGGEDAELTIYPAAAHASWEPASMEPDLVEWLFSHALKKPAPELFMTDDEAKESFLRKRKRWNTVCSRLKEALVRQTAWARNVPEAAPLFIALVRRMNQAPLSTRGQIDEALDLVDGGLADFLVKSIKEPFNTMKYAMIGPFDNSDREPGTQRVYPVETDLLGGKPNKEYVDAKNGKVTWRSVTGTCRDGNPGCVDLHSFFRASDWAVTYLVTEIQSPAERSVLLHVGSDDGIKIWVNGHIVGVVEAFRSAIPGENVFEARFNKGWNRVIVKCVDGEQGWRFFLDITDQDGLPFFDLETKAPDY